MNLSFSGPAQGDKHMACGNVSGLPARIQKILCRFGVLLGEPEVFGGACGGDVTAIACFQTLEAAEAGGSQHNEHQRTFFLLCCHMMPNAYGFCSLVPR